MQDNVQDNIEKAHLKLTSQEIFDVPFENYTNVDDLDEYPILVLSNTMTGYHLTEPSPIFQLLFRKSVYISKVTKIYSKSELIKYADLIDENVHLNELNYVAKFDDKTSEDFHLNIDKFEDFIYFLRLCDEYTLDANLIEEELVNSYWIYSWIRDNIKKWDKNMDIWNTDIDRGLLDCDIFERTALNDIKKQQNYRQITWNHHDEYPTWTSNEETTIVVPQFSKLITDIPEKYVLPFEEAIIYEFFELCERHRLFKLRVVIANLFGSSLDWNWKGLKIENVWRYAGPKFLEWGMRFMYMCELNLAITERYLDDEYLEEQSRRCLIPLDVIKRRDINVSWYNSVNGEFRLLGGGGSKYFPVHLKSNENELHAKPIETSEEFNQNLYKIVGNLFQYISWDGVAISGSIMPRCMYNLNDRFKSLYEGSDIDVMIKANNDIDFDYKVQKFYESILKVQPLAELSKIITPNQHKYIITCESNNNDPNALLIPKLDIFRVKNVAYVVSRFHFAMVRAFYDGRQVWMFPSCISSFYTKMTSDIRWVSCKSDLKLTLLKYLQRGFQFKLSYKNYDKLNTDYYREILKDLKAWRTTFRQDGKKGSIRSLWDEILLK